MEILKGTILDKLKLKSLSTDGRPLSGNNVRAMD